MKKLPDNVWSNNYEKCIGCGTTKNKYEAHGYCVKCYSKFYYYPNVRKKRKKPFKGRKQYICSYCKKKYFRRPNMLKKDSKNNFCSRMCNALYYKGNDLSKDDLIRKIKEEIKKSNRYVTCSELQIRLKMSYSTLINKYNISIAKINKELGFKRSGSSFELIVGNFLEEFIPDLERQKIFDGCISKKGFPLKFDFYSERLKLFIETDGAFHDKKIFKKLKKKNDYNFEMVREERLLEIYSNDSIKNIWAKENNYYLIRIPYVRKVTRDYIVDILKSHDYIKNNPDLSSRLFNNLEKEQRPSKSHLAR